ncbi:MAG: penicillin acylase family protein [Opitutales bacterium]|nr:penicillin acylase family protein [Opitutales bacterium]
MKTLPALLAACLLALTPSARADVPAGLEILWDPFGIAHVYAPDEAALFFGYGFAQMHSHGDLVLKLYGESRGRAAEYWGREYIRNDRWVRTHDVAGRAARWLEEQTPAFRANLEAFAAGMNAYADRHPEALDAERQRALPITAADVIGHFHRIVHFSYLSSFARVRAAVQDYEPAMGGIESNAWALAPARTGGIETILLMNPHLPWRDWFTYYEIRLTAPGIDLYGASQIGFPVLRFCFSDTHGFTQTVNGINAADLYALTLTDDGQSWLYDGEARPFETREETLRVRQPDGSLTEEILPVRHSIHGPVVWDDDGLTLALRVAALDRPHLIEQYWQMALAPDFEAYQAQVRRLEVPTFNITYADREGNVMYLYNGTLPKRPPGDWDWTGIVPGDTSATLWTEYHPYEDLPKVINPPTGWVQNTNDPPWTSTWPRILDPDTFPSYTAGREHTFRSTRSLRFLTDPEPLTFDRVRHLQGDSRLEGADRLLPPLAAAVAVHSSPEAVDALNVLLRWDRRVDPQSGGAVLYANWVARLMGTTFNDRSQLALAQDPADPFTTPGGLADPAHAVRELLAAAAETRTRHGALDVPWGDVHRIRRGPHDLPARGSSGGLGSFHVNNYGPPGDDHTREVVFGDTFVAIVGWSDEGLRADLRLSYGNASQPGSPHAHDQVELLARNTFRSLIRSRAYLESHHTRRDQF